MINNLKRYARYLEITSLIGLTVLFFHCTGNNAVQEGKLNIKDANIYYKIMGKGSPTFVLHGGPGDTHDTMLQLKDLADDYRLIFYDQRAGPGHGPGSGDGVRHCETERRKRSGLQ